MTEFDCQETKKHVHEFLHSELSTNEMQDITDHLANCDSCEADYDFEVIFNQVIVRSCTEAPPQELADRVLGKIREIQQGNHH
jgi:anti-sigma factor (TIGR02949 family)